MDISTLKNYFDSSNKFNYRQIGDLYDFINSNAYFYFTVAHDSDKGEYVNLRRSIFDVDFGNVPLIERLSKTTLLTEGVDKSLGTDIIFDTLLYQVVAIKKIYLKEISDIENFESEFGKCTNELLEIGKRYIDFIKNNQK